MQVKSVQYMSPYIKYLPDSDQQDRSSGNENGPCWDLEVGQGYSPHKMEKKLSPREFRANYSLSSEIRRQ